MPDQDYSEAVEADTTEATEQVDFTDEYGSEEERISAAVNMLNGGAADAVAPEEESMTAGEQVPDAEPEEAQEEQADVSSRFNDLVAEEARQRALIAEERRLLQDKESKFSKENERLEQVIAENERYKAALAGAKQNPLKLLAELGYDEEAGSKFAEDAYYYFNQDKAPAGYDARFEGIERDSEIGNIKSYVDEMRQSHQQEILQLRSELEQKDLATRAKSFIENPPEEFEHMSVWAKANPSQVQTQVLGIYEHAKAQGHDLSLEDAAEIFEDAMAELADDVRSTYDTTPEVEAPAPERSNGGRTLSNRSLSQGRADISLEEMSEDERLQLAIQQLQ